MNRAAVSAVLPLMALTALSVACPSSAAAADDATGKSIVSADTAVSLQTDTIRLRYVLPSLAVKAMVWPDASGVVDPSAGARSLVPAGVICLAPDDVRKTLTVTGSADGIRGLRQIASLLDIRPHAVRFAVRILRPMDASAAMPPTVPLLKASEQPPSNRLTAIASGLIESTNNRPVELDIFADSQGFRIQLLPHINGDGSVSLGASVSIDPPTATAGSNAGHDTKTNRRLEKGRRLFVTTTGTHAESYVVEVTPTVLDASPTETAVNK